MTTTPDKLLAALRWRYATKRFDPARKIPAATWDAIEESLVLTPSSFGLQPWKFIVIQDPLIRANLAPRILAAAAGHRGVPLRRPDRPQRSGRH